MGQVAVAPNTRIRTRLAVLGDATAGANTLIATGGTVTISAGYVYHTFTADASLIVFQAGAAEYLVVGGGGGGGSGTGGGGGAGRVRSGSGTLAAGTHAVTIGAGGAGGSGFPGGTQGTDGGSSALGSILTSTGGGGGGTNALPGKNGGNGGGGGNTQAGGTGTDNNGGAGSANVAPAFGGGGGGSTAAAGAAGTGSNGGAGGAGTTWSGTLYGGGGGGGRFDSGTGGAGGSGGGGTGGSSSLGPTNGTANTGGGGGGQGANGAAAAGSGGSGVVVVRYPTDGLLAGLYATGGAITADGNYIRHTFLAGSTFATNVAALGASISTEYLVVGGGGGGGARRPGGGGGAGALKSGSLTVVANQTVTIGAGGAGGVGGAEGTRNGSPGNNSVLGSITSGGGGYGAGGGTTSPDPGGNGANGSSGGGGGGSNTAGTSNGGTGNAPGNNGGSGEGNASGALASGGGGGGAGAVGANGNGSGTGGAGGNGSVWNSTTYAGGGGGAGGTNSGAGGSGGGGAGSNVGAGTSGTANTGGGGGGTSTTGNGGDGGSGIVVVRYKPGDLVTSYEALLRAQGATHYWPFQTAKLDTQTESDVIDSKTMTMSGGDCTALSAGAGPLGGTVAATDAGIVFVLADTERMTCSTAAFDSRQNWSWSGWMRASSLTGNGPVFMYLRGGSPAPYLMVMHRDDKGGLCVQIDAGGGAVFFDPGTINLADSAWHHIAVTRAYSASAPSDTWNILVDGTTVATSTAATIGFTPGNTGSSMTWTEFGRDDTDSNAYGGDLAHCAYAVGVTWTPAQVLAQYNMRT